jgi:hypothetical protein
MSEAQRVDVAASYARRVEGGIQVVLLLPDADPGPGPVEVRLREAGRTLKREAAVHLEPNGVRLELVVPAQRLGQGVWRLAVRTAPEDSFTRIEARLLTSRRQPVALLPGPAPDTRMPAPEPAARPAGRPARGLPARAAGRVRGLVGRLR